MKSGPKQDYIPSRLICSKTKQEPWGPRLADEMRQEGSVRLKPRTEEVVDVGVATCCSRLNP
jgi:hypothetical protein